MALLLLSVFSRKAKTMNPQKTLEGPEAIHRGGDSRRSLGIKLPPTAVTFWRPWVGCPLTDGLARIEVETCVQQFGSSRIRFFEMKDCSLWPAKERCSLRCIRTCEEIAERRESQETIRL